MAALGQSWTMAPLPTEVRALLKVLWSPEAMQVAETRVEVVRMRRATRGLGMYILTEWVEQFEVMQCLDKLLRL